MTTEELIALMEYKAENIKARFSPATFKAVAEALRRLKELEDK